MAFNLVLVLVAFHKVRYLSRSSCCFRPLNDCVETGAVSSSRTLQLICFVLFSLVCQPSPGIPYLRRGDFHVNDDGGQRGLEELRRVVDGVGVQHHQLQGAGQLEDPLDLTLHLG